MKNPFLSIFLSAFISTFILTSHSEARIHFSEILPGIDESQIDPIIQISEHPSDNNILKPSHERPSPPNTLQRNISQINMINMNLPLNIASDNEIVTSLLDIIEKHPDWLGGLRANHLKLKSFSKGLDANKIYNIAYIQFVQEHEGLEIENSYVNFTVKFFKEKNVIMSAQAKIFLELDMIKAPLISIERIRKLAASTLGLDYDKVRIKNENNRIRFIDDKWRKTIEISFMHNDYTVTIDQNTGEHWVEDNRQFVNDVHGSVSGRGVLFSPYLTGNNLNTLSLSDLKLTSNLGSFVYTNPSGNFQFPSDQNITNVTAYLKGQWANVTADTFGGGIGELSFSGTPLPAQPMDIIFNPTGNNPFATAQVNGYYHTNFVHNWIASRLNNPTPINDFNGDGVNDAIEVKISTSGCAGCYSGNKIQLPPDRAYDTIIYHEYGHFVDDKYGGYQPYISEGWGDLLAVYASGQPFEAEDSGGGVRSAVNRSEYTGPSAGYASTGTWAGFAWRLRQRLINSPEFAHNEPAAIALAENLIIPVFESAPSDVPDALLQVLIRDDNDGDWTNGTPHIESIYYAAGHHKIPIPELDSIPPATVGGLSAKSAGLSRIKLQWVAPGDDNSTGRAYFYDIRYATSPILTTNDFNAATKIDDDTVPVPAIAGNTQEMIVNGLLPGTTYYFAMKVFDNVKNSSGLSNNTSATTLAGQISFSDNFETGALGWTTQSSDPTVTWHLSTARSSSPTTSFVYNNGTTYNTYPAGNSGSLTSPLINLKSVSDAAFVFSYWYQTLVGEIDYLDRKRIEVSIDNGATWTTLFQYSRYNLPWHPYNIWKPKVIDLSNYIGQEIRLRFHFDTNNPQASPTYEGWYIDDVNIYTIPSHPSGHFQSH